MAVDITNLATPPDSGEAARIGAEHIREIKKYITRIPQINFSADRTLLATDVGKRLYHPSTDATARIVTIPPGVFAVEAVISILNAQGAGSLTITPGVGVTLVQVGTGSTGARTVPAACGCLLEQTETNVWYLTGTGVT